MVAGALLMAWAANSASHLPQPAFEFRSSPISPEALPEFAGSGLPEKLERFEFRAPGLKNPVATAIVARDRQGRLAPLGWSNAVTEPVLFSDLAPADASKVLAAIREHVGEEAVVLSWWDLSRLIRSVAQRRAPLDDPFARGLLTPAAWSAGGDEASGKQRSLWGEGVPREQGEIFAKFVSALLLDEQQGSGALAELAGGKPAFVAVHLSDIWKAAAARPDIVSIAYRDFPGAVGSHGVMKAVRQWIEEQKIAGGYAIEPIGGAVRLHYFPRKSDSELLLARMLPFSTSNPLRLERFQLVYQHKGYWIYKLKSA